MFKEIMQMVVGEDLNTVSLLSKETTLPLCVIAPVHGATAADQNIVC